MNTSDWDVQSLIGSRVWIKIAKVGEVQGIIEAIPTPFLSEDREQSITLSLFSVRPDDGKLVDVPGSAFSRIDPKTGI